MAPSEPFLRFIIESEEHEDAQSNDDVHSPALPPIYHVHSEAQAMIDHELARPPFSSTSPAPAFYPSLSSLYLRDKFAASSSRQHTAIKPEPKLRDSHQFDPLIRRGRWTNAEDSRLLASVTRHGPNKWKLNAFEVKTRTSDQCWKRWNDSLDPSLNHSPWTPEEDEILEASVAENGRTWSKIAMESLNGRSGLMCKNRWDHLQRKKKRLVALQEKKCIAEVADFILPNSPASTLLNAPEVPSQGFHVGAVRNTGDPRERASGRLYPNWSDSGSTAIRLHQPTYVSATLSASLPPQKRTHPPIMRTAAQQPQELKSNVAPSDTNRFDYERSRHLLSSSSNLVASSMSLRNTHATSMQYSSSNGGMRPQQHTLGAQLLLAEPETLPSIVSVTAHPVYNSDHFTPSFTALQYTTTPAHTYDDSRHVLQQH